MHVSSCPYLTDEFFRDSIVPANVAGTQNNALQDPKGDVFLEK